MRILIVDDETVIRKGVVKLLENSHAAISEIDEARNGEKRCRRSHAPSRIS